MAWPAFPPAAADEPAGLPDLKVEGIFFSVGGAPTGGAPAGTETVNITVYASDIGLDNTTSVNFTLTVNGTVLGAKPADQGWGEGPGQLLAFFDWATGALPAGVYEIGASVNDSAGDQNPADNAASVKFTIFPRWPSLGIRLDQTAVEAEVSAISPRFSTFTGNLTATDLFGQILRVTVESTSDIGWVTVSFPSEVLFVGDRTTNFSLILEIPAGSPAGNGSLTVTARLRYLGRDLDASASATVSLLPFYSFILSTRQSTLDIETGGTCTFTFQLRNDGNTNDSFTLEIANSGDLDSKDASVTLSCRTLGNVGPGEAGTFKVTFRGPQDWTIWKADSTLVLVKASSEGARSEYRLVTRSCPVFARETGTFPPWVFPFVIIALVFIAGVYLALGIKTLHAIFKNKDGFEDLGHAKDGSVDVEPRPPRI